VVEYTVGTGGVTKGDVVKFSAAMTVVKATAADENAAGIALQTKVAAAVVAVVKKGLVKATVGGAVGVGALVGTGATKVLALGFGTTYGAADALSTLASLVGRNEGEECTADADLALIRVNVL